MKFPVWLARLLAFTQTCIGLCLTAFASITNNFLYFVIGLCNVFIGVIVDVKVKQRSTNE